MTGKRFFQTSEAVVLSAIIAAATVWGGIGVAQAEAGEPEWSKHPGYVDGSMFADLADDDDTLIEVTIRGPLLRIVSKAITKQDDKVGQLLDQIVSINAVVVGLDGESNRAARMIREMGERLEKDNWERVARIREDDSNIIVYVLHDDEVIDGLTVIVGEDDELVFANIAGRIDLELIGDLGMKLNIPGLGELTGGEWENEIKKHKKSRRR